MKQFLIGSAFLMFISSLPADATNTHAISLKNSVVEPQKISFMQAFGDTLPPIGHGVTFCREHKARAGLGAALPTGAADLRQLRELVPR
jgi:hypothetical protein